MHPRASLLAAILAVSHATMASAQEPRFDIAQPEHALLERFAGEWEFERLSVPAEGSEPETLGAGTISAAMVGDFFVFSHWSGNIYGSDYKALQALGYDIEQAKYTGYWVDSFISFRWELSGTIDEGSRELTLTTRGPGPTGGTMTFRERYQFHSGDSITIIGEIQRGESWVAFTTTRLTRKH
jgi:hypothetical protein